MCVNNSVCMCAYGKVYNIYIYIYIYKCMVISGYFVHYRHVLEYSNIHI